MLPDYARSLISGLSNFARRIPQDRLIARQSQLAIRRIIVRAIRILWARSLSRTCALLAVGYLNHK